MPNVIRTDSGNKKVPSRCWIFSFGISDNDSSSLTDILIPCTCYTYICGSKRWLQGQQIFSGLIVLNEPWTIFELRVCTNFWPKIFNAPLIFGNFQEFMGIQGTVEITMCKIPPFQARHNILQRQGLFTEWGDATLLHEIPCNWCNKINILCQILI